ncbi:hypothetical protein DMC30DRAFT_12098 [Rhodotorula diobovata]|uniref:Uncharacterized protein n=1 Tax=Rhodotorula diobovata TaxID=5288 RepID=A0A5C5FR78_9BASI|nr:hypothetical protein DMC30DRAFT_12098 [Rhodotorula diobovata]
MSPKINLDCIAEVLRHTTFTDTDLARACLVSRAVYPLASRLLYGDLALCFSDNRGYIGDSPLLCAIEAHESHKLETLLDSDRLRRLVRRVEVAFDSLERDVTLRYDEPGYELGEIVEACPNMDDIGADAGAWFPEMAPSSSSTNGACAPSAGSSCARARGRCLPGSRRSSV